MTIFVQYIREIYFKNEIKRKIKFKDYTFLVCIFGFIIITLLFIKKSNSSKIASYIYIVFGLFHIFYSLIIQLIEIINENKKLWKEGYLEKHIDVGLFFVTVIIFIIRKYSFGFFSLYTKKIKYLQKFLEIEDKDFFLDSLSEKLFENEGNELNMTY